MHGRVRRDGASWQVRGRVYSFVAGQLEEIVTMPLYEFDCKSCGAFDVFRAVADVSKPVLCPDCLKTASRVWTAPSVRAMAPLNRMAAERNEKASHQPHVCKSGCGCGGRRKPKSTRPTIETASGRTRHAYTGSRPWVIEHQ